MKDQTVKGLILPEVGSRERLGKIQGGVQYVESLILEGSAAEKCQNKKGKQTKI
jgi:hypothetical protein